MCSTCSLISHDALRGGNDCGAQALHDLGHILAVSVDTQAGLGHTAQTSDNGLAQVNIPDTEDCTIVWQDPNHFSVTGIDKQKVGQYAAEIRGKKPPEPYKGKGIRYAGEVVKHKEGKAGKGKK